MNRTYEIDGVKVTETPEGELYSVCSGRALVEYRGRLLDAQKLAAAACSRGLGLLSEDDIATACAMDPRIDVAKRREVTT